MELTISRMPPQMAVENYTQTMKNDRL
eukprot:IDg7875t1